VPVALIVIAIAIVIFVIVISKGNNHKSQHPPTPSRLPPNPRKDLDPTGPDRHDASFARIAAVRAIRDPRDAALALMVALARLEGDVSRDTATVIKQECAQMFGESENSISARLEAIQFSTGGVDYELVLSEVKTLINRSLTALEKHQLWRALKAMSESSGTPSNGQRDMLDMTENAFDLMKPEGKSI
jgi:hypothetical protein